MPVNDKPDELLEEESKILLRESPEGAGTDSLPAPEQKPLHTAAKETGDTVASGSGDTAAKASGHTAKPDLEPDNHGKARAETAGGSGAAPAAVPGPQSLGSRITSVIRQFFKHPWFLWVSIFLSVLVFELGLFVSTLEQPRHYPVSENYILSTMMVFGTGALLFCLWLVNLFYTCFRCETGSFKTKFFNVLQRGFIPAVIGNAMFASGLILSLAAVLISGLFYASKALIASSTGLMQNVFMVALPLGAIVITVIALIAVVAAGASSFSKLFHYMEQKLGEGRPRSRFASGQSVGFLIGLSLGLLGVWTSLSLEGMPFARLYVVHSSLWAVPIFISLIFMGSLSVPERKRRSVEQEIIDALEKMDR